MFSNWVEPLRLQAVVSSTHTQLSTTLAYFHRRASTADLLFTVEEFRATVALGAAVVQECGYPPGPAAAAAAAASGRGDVGELSTALWNRNLTGSHLSQFNSVLAGLKVLVLCELSAAHAFSPRGREHYPAATRLEGES